MLGTVAQDKDGRSAGDRDQDQDQDHDREERFHLGARAQAWDRVDELQPGNEISDTGISPLADVADDAGLLPSLPALDSHTASMLKKAISKVLCMLHNDARLLEVAALVRGLEKHLDLIVRAPQATLVQQLLKGYVTKLRMLVDEVRGSQHCSSGLRGADCLTHADSKMRQPIA
jgi:hypothetical protein